MNYFYHYNENHSYSIIHAGRDMNSINIKYHADHALIGESASPPSHFPVKLISSENLFEAGKEVLIQHRGEQYHLRLTRNDKLILTK